LEAHATAGDSALFSPLQLRELRLPNRVVISPMCTYSADDGMASDWHFAHLARFALGGAGTVFVEATAVRSDGGLSRGDMGLWKDEQMAPLRRIAEFCKQCGVVPAIQLGHAGRKGSSQRPWVGNGPLTDADAQYGDMAWPTVSAGTTPVNEKWPTPEALSLAKMDVIRQSWLAATRRAQQAGFEIVEVHMAHGYLLHQFLSPVTNTRSDGYGGSLENRMRYPLEIAELVRQAWPEDRPVFVRISAVDEGWSIEDSIVLARRLKQVGIDVVDCSTGGLGRAPEALRVSRGYGFQVPFSQAVKTGAAVKTMAVGLILDPALANRIVVEERADLVAIARVALDDPNWPLHARRALHGRDRAFEAWPKQYGVWLEQRERVLEKIRSQAAPSDAHAAAGGPSVGGVSPGR
jgi:2,4-dienoyl-CoA reductase-like NADH-dependent reductase (Old Yellow Enzyme family)